MTRGSSGREAFLAFAQVVENGHGHPRKEKDVGVFSIGAMKDLYVDFVDRGEQSPKRLYR